MFNRRAIVASVMAAGLAMPTMVAAQSASAAPNKVPLCHYDADTDSYKLLSVSGNGKAVDAHLAHGDALPGAPVPTMPGSTFDENCVPVVDEVILAVAYTDQDPGDGGYNADTDVLIAKVVDDGDGVPSTGDTIITNQYPLDFLAGGFGSFTKTTHVGALRLATSELLEYQSSDGTFAFVIRDIGEAYVEQTSAVRGSTAFQDGFGLPQPGEPSVRGPNVDILEWDPSSPSAPGAPFTYKSVRPTTKDDSFIDVELRYTP